MNVKSGSAYLLACVQTSPLPQEKSGEEIFPEGEGTSVHRLLAYQLNEEIVKKWLGLKLGQNKALCALVTKSLV